MVLNLKSSPFFFLTLCGFTFSLPIFAQTQILKDVFKYEVSNSDCPVSVKSGSRFISYPKKLELGTIAVGKPLQNSADIIIFKTSETRHLQLAAKKSCLFAAPLNSDIKNVVKTSAPLKKNLLIGTFHWQDNVKVSYQAIDTPLRSTTVAVGLTLQVMKVREKDERGMIFQLIYGKSQLALATAPSASSNVQEFGVSNVHTAALIAAPSYMLRPQSQNIAFGLHVPLMLRYAKYPLSGEIGSQATVKPSFKFLTGIMLESRFERSSFIFSQKVGFLNIPQSLTWGLDAGWSF